MSTLWRNTAWLTGATIGQKIIAFLYFTVIARTIGDSAIGGYALALALTTSIGVLDDIGLTSVLIREIAKEPKRAGEWLREVLGWKMVTMPFTVLLAIAAPQLLGFSEEATLLTWVAIVVMLADTLSVTMYGVLRGLHTLSAEGVGMFVGQSLTTVFGAAVLLSGVRDLWWLVAALIIGSTWNVFWSAWQVSRRLGWNALIPSFSWNARWLRLGSMFFLAGVLIKISSYTDALIINSSLGQGAVGDYNAAYKLTYAFQFLPMAFVGALYPAMSAAAQNKEELRRILLQAFRYVSLLVFPIVFGIYALAPQIIGLFYGVDFVEAVPVLQTLIFVLPFIFLDFPLGSLLNATHRPHVKTGILAIATLVNVVGNVTLIPMFGIWGAAVAGLSSFGTMMILGYIAVARQIALPVREALQAVAPYAVAGAVMAIAVTLAETIVPWLLTIPLGALVFVVFVWGLGGVPKEVMNKLWRS
jgi:O-antigen/teichoic acid export membrane protein